MLSTSSSKFKKKVQGRSLSVVFGPINSRRFGMSLGIDLSPKEKSCNFDCVYCELKGAKPRNFIPDPPSVADIITEVKKALKTHPNIDVITISANGEPTLYLHLKELITELNLVKTDKKLLILSNGTGALNPKICSSLKDLDIVKFSLDSAIQSTFKKIDRDKSGLDIKNIIKAMADFRKNFQGLLVLEILVVAGFNDKQSEFLALNEAINFIAPDRVDISSIDRPPAYPVKSVSYERLNELAGFIKNVPVVLAKAQKSTEIYNFSCDEILQTLSRRPQSQANVSENFSESSKQNLATLIDQGKVHKVSVAGVNFYKIRQE